MMFDLQNNPGLMFTVFKNRGLPQRDLIKEMVIAGQYKDGSMLPAVLNQEKLDTISGLKTQVDEQSKTITEQAATIAELKGEAPQDNHEKDDPADTATTIDQAATVKAQAATIIDQAAKIETQTATITAKEATITRQAATINDQAAKITDQAATITDLENKLKTSEGNAKVLLAQNQNFIKTSPRKMEQAVLVVLEKADLAAVTTKKARKELARQCVEGTDLEKLAN